MAKSEEAQEVPIRKKYPRAQQDGEAGTAHSAEAHSVAYELPNKDSQSFGGAECPGKLIGSHGSDSAGAALRREPDETQPASSKDATYDHSNQHEELDICLQRLEAAELSRCGSPEKGGHATQLRPVNQESMPCPRTRTLVVHS